jgi:putative flippase GtrA
MTKTLFQLGRHQAGSVVATVVDFSTMTALVELAHVPPVGATVFGAIAGGVTNFVLGRRWIFRAHERDLAPQALRYAMVSAASAGFNAFGEQIVYGFLGLQYIVARALVAIVVSLAWNYPMQRSYVFAP